MQQPTLTSYLYPTQGYHPTSTTRVQIPPHLIESLNSCTTHLLYTLPPLLFVDKYELTNYQNSYTFHHWGTSNLELPVFAVDQVDSLLLLNVKNECDVECEVKVPLHLRYGDPLVKSENRPAQQEAKLDWPTGFFACPPSVDIPVSSTQPLLPDEVLSLLTTNMTQGLKMIPIVPTAVNNNESAQIVRVPVGDSAHIALVEFGTVTTIFLLFGYLIYVSQRTVMRLRTRERQKEE
ncbi:hypothetical protein AMATHDRAFT_150840 [Amanita thiersii Skay4041]|uniref:Protein PBN1 n=1 Tax=Amanita thiersii Skay4041 TaxID=703135 RepID=A0A2A9NJX8_9AGAR|nr:hypothetical protein AMATHDRAFT_150840 [Amanita thiersii Skay4041]